MAPSDSSARLWLTTGQGGLGRPGSALGGWRTAPANALGVGVGRLAVYNTYHSEFTIILIGSGQAVSQPWEPNPSAELAELHPLLERRCENHSHPPLWDTLGLSLANDGRIVKMARYLRLIVHALALFCGAACQEYAKAPRAVMSGNSDPSSSWTDSVYAVGFRPLIEADTVCSNCISLKRLALIGDADGPGYLLESQHLVLDSMGRYWIGHRGSVKLFDSAGVFLRDVGRPGQGPGEFGTALPLYADRTGAVHVLDLDNSRITIISPDLTVREHRRIPGSFERAEPLGDGEGYVMNTWLPTAEYVGHPLHVVRNSRIEHSFGMSTNEQLVQNPFTARRVLAVDRADRIIGVHWYNYVIEVWSDAGTRITGYEMPSLNSFAPLPGRISADNPYPVTIRDIHLDDDDRLWVLMTVPRSDWETKMEERLLPNGDIILDRKAGTTTSDLLTTRIDVIDLASSVIIARSEQTTLLARFLNDSTMWSFEYLADGTPQVGVWQLSLETRR